MGQTLDGFFALFPLSIAVCGVAVLAYQSYRWLTLGYWKPLTTSLVLDKVLPASFFQWLYSSNCWKGINNMVFFVLNSSLGLFLLIFSLVLRLFIAKFFKLCSRAATTEDGRSWRGWASRQMPDGTASATSGHLPTTTSIGVTSGGQPTTGWRQNSGQAGRSFFDCPVYLKPVVGDINGDCKVNGIDFAFITGHRPLQIIACESSNRQ
jgi:hypothetical protein